MESTHNMKNTPIGLIPEGWSARPLGDLCEIHGRIGFRGYTKADLVRKGEGAITFSPSDIDDQRISYKDCDYISWAKYIESPEIQVKEGDILFCKTASIGKCAQIWDLKEKATINPQFVLLNDFKCNSSLLYYMLAFSSFQNRVLVITGGSTIPTISQEAMKKQLIPIPDDPDEQNRIAETLLSIDKIIGALDEAIAKKRQIKEGLMQQLLTGKTRLPGFNGEWEDIPFKSIYKYAKEGGTPSTGVAEYYNPAIVPFAKIEDLKDKYLTRVESYISESGVEHSSAWLIPVNSVILSNGATLGEVSINKITTTTKQGILGIILKEDFSPEFIYYLFKGRSFRREMEKVTTHGTMDCAYLKDLNTISLRIPPLTEQEAIASVISSVDKEIVGLESQRDKYALIKQGMMQKLLTGKTRLI